MKVYHRGGHARSSIHRVVQDHYKSEDIDLDKIGESQ